MYRHTNCTHICMPAYIYACTCTSYKCTLTAREHCALDEWESLGGGCPTDVFCHVLSLLGRESLFRDLVINGCASQRLFLSQTISDAFTSQPSVEIKLFGICHIHFRPGKACFWSHGLPHVCARGQGEGWELLNGFSTWLTVVSGSHPAPSQLFLGLSC